MAGRFSVEAIFKAVDRVTAPVSRMQNRVGKFTRTAERGFRKLNRGLGSFVRGLKAATGTVIKFGAIGLGAVTGAVGLLIREFSKVEDAEAAFTPLMGSAKKAKELIDQLNTTAASTPFQFETLSKATSQLLPVMNGDIENTVKTLRMLGDTAGGNAQKLDSITRGFTKAMLKGKVDMESLNMIAEAGVPIFTELADSMGTKVNAAFFKMISAGKVATKDLNKAFEKMTSKGGVFFKGMEISSKTTSGMFSTLKDNISLTAAEIGGVLAPTIKEMIAGATVMAKQFREWVKANRELISTKFIEFIESVKRGFAALVRVFDYLSEHGGTIAAVIGWVAGFVIALKILIGVLTLFNLIMAMNPIGLMIIGIAALILAIKPLRDLLMGIVGFIVEIVKGIAGVGMSVFKSAIGLFSDDEDETKPDGAPGVVSPQDRLARKIDEQRTTSTAEVTIKDETKRAQVTKGKMGNGIALEPSGAF